MRLRVEAVSFAYPGAAHVLDAVTLALESGESVGLIGENGAGKTTLAKLLCGLLLPGSGEVWVGDWNTRQHSVAQLARRIAYVFQNPDDQLFERTVAAEVAFGPRNLGLPPAEVEARVHASLSRVALDGLQARHPYELNPTQRKFVALAAADALETPAMILDEPTTGLDGPGMQILSQYVEERKREARTLITISHDMDFVAEHADRVILLSRGTVASEGSPASMFLQTERLAASQLEAPQLVRLAERLGWETAPLNVEAFVGDWRQRQKLEGQR
jgi:energy-coupling factor transport system ATP-binding protein